MAKRRKFYKKFRKPSSRNYDDPAYKAWRKDVYKRDHHKCQWPGCKYRGRKVYAHHIRPWSSYPSLRFDVSNGITLCYNHHKQVTGAEEDYVRLFCEVLRINAKTKKKK